MMTISILFCFCNDLELYCIVLSLLKKEPQTKTAPFRNRYAILICARNEEKVIGDLIDSISRQTYPRRLLDTFVMADNCQDDTARIAEEHGAYVYIRHNENEIGKGYALQELLRHIEEDHPGKYAGYFVIDADNILKEDFIEKMNDTFCEGHEIITCYRNSKNPSQNWISAAYALSFIKDCRFLNYPRHLSSGSCKITGTGFFFSEKIRQKMEDWPYHLLTEDLQFTIDQTCQGEKIAYCKDAVIYDEQPVDFLQSWNQRMRWAKGYLQVMRQYAGSLLKNVLKGSFSCFDLCCSTLFTISLAVLSACIRILMILFSLYDRNIFLVTIHGMLMSIVRGYILLYLMGLLTTICEWKNIHADALHKITYTFSFPIFVFTYVPVSIAALFGKVTWKPIRHSFRMKEMNIGNNC